MLRPVPPSAVAAVISVPCKLPGVVKKGKVHRQQDRQQLGPWK